MAACRLTSSSLARVVVDETQPWTVLADPEGGELCAFVRDPERCRTTESTSWSSTPPIQSRSRRGGPSATPPMSVMIKIRASPGSTGSPGMPWAMVFTWVPEPKTVKNRMHWDVWGETAALVAAGATLLRGRDDEIGWDVLADPEGNEFCVFSSARGSEVLLHELSAIPDVQHGSQRTAGPRVNE